MGSTVLGLCADAKDTRVIVSFIAQRRRQRKEEEEEKEGEDKEAEGGGEEVLREPVILRTLSSL